MRCNVCSSPTLIEDRRYFDIKGYNYGVCEHTDLGDEMECPRESTACGKLRVSVEKSKVLDVIEEIKHLIPTSRSRRNLDFYRIKQDILRGRGSRPTEGNQIKDTLINAYSFDKIFVPCTRT